MNDPPGKVGGPIANAQSELASVRAEISEARVALAKIKDDAEDCQERIEGMERGNGAPLVVVNQQLVLALLRAQNAADASARLQTTLLLEGKKTLFRCQQRHRDQQEANTHLLLAALSARDLQGAAEQAQQRHKDLLATVAHELRHPLAPIRSAALILGKIPSREPLLVRMQTIIERQVSHMSRLVDDLVDVSRVGTGKLSLERKVTEITGLVSAACEISRPAMVVRGQTLEIDIAPQPIEMDGDPVRLTQIFINLLDNASKYTPRGGVIHLKLKIARKGVEITVADNGIGITAKALPHVFDPFVQDAHATVFNGVGLGIGLTVVRQLVEAHGGRVLASSPGTGMGSQFVVWFPLAEPGSTPHP